MKILNYITLLFLLSPAIGISAENDKHAGHSKASGIESLSPELRKLLSKEMQALQKGMMSIIPAYVSGNWSEIGITAEKMKNSYILKQSLTESQMKELQTTLPHEFIEKDKRFHYLAGMLEHVAKESKPELINFYFSEMTESCVACHAKFATHKFPALKMNKQSKHAH